MFLIEVKDMSPSVRFVHCGGFHFDSRSWEGPVSWINMRNKDLWKTFEAVLKLCRTEKADFLFLTGDLFEQEYASKETVERVARSLGRLKGTRVFITPGEKDPLLTTSAYRFTEWLDNVHIFSGGINKVTIPSQEVTIYGSGWATYKQEGNFLEDFQTADNDGQIKFMLLHAEVESTENTKGFIPLKLEQIEASGLTYLALGHKEKWSGTQEAGDTYWADCGWAEPRSFAESGPRGVLLGETDGKTTKIEFLELSQRSYIEKSYLLPAEMEDLVDQMLADNTEQERQKNLFRFNISGALQESEETTEKLRELLVDKFCHIQLRYSKTKTNSHLGNKFATMTEVFMNETQIRLATVHSAKGQRHWELVRKIGTSALNQGYPNTNSERQMMPGIEVVDKKRAIFWPDNIEDDFYFRVRNLREVGDEEVSLEKARHSLIRAKKRVEEQAESMGQFKSDYEALRRDWEQANRRQEEQRLLQIEIKKLQVKKNQLDEKIVDITKIQERLALLHRNPDYRELRRLQGELPRLEERSQWAKAELIAYTRSTQVDWDMIEGLREEYLEWALLQEEINNLAMDIQQRNKAIIEIENVLQMSGYQELPDNEDQRLLQLQKEWDESQTKLKNLTPIMDEIISTEKILNIETTKLQDFAVIGRVTPSDERRIIQTVQLLGKWQNSRISRFIDRSLKKQLEWSSIEEKLTSRLARYFQKYQIVDYEEFQLLQQKLQDQQQVVGRLQTKLMRLQKETERKKTLRKIVHSRDQALQKAFSIVQATDLKEWMDGWKDYHQRKKMLAEMHDELNKKTEQQQLNEEKLLKYVNQLRDKVKDWDSSASNIDDVLRGVMTAASKLLAKEETEKELASLKQTYHDQVGRRDMNHLVTVLEPLADLEREECLTVEERQTELLACYQEFAEIKCQLSNAEETIRRDQSVKEIQDLEKKIDSVKLQWNNYEELQRAVDATQLLLEDSQQKWQTKYGRALGALAKNIFISAFSLQPSINEEDIMVKTKHYYFAYRMALALLTLDDNLEIPVYFSVKEMKEPQIFWEDILAYLRELSLSRKVSFRTSDALLKEMDIPRFEI